MVKKVPVTELESRMKRFRAAMDNKNPDWRLAVFVGKINQYYFTGTMQDGILMIPRDSEAVLWVRRSIERAMEESLFPDIRPMTSYRDAAAAMKVNKSPVHMETEIVPLAMYQRLQKYFDFTGCQPLDREVMAVRSVKSKYELDLIRESGRIHRDVLEKRVPGLLREGMSESEFTSILFGVMVEEGYHGITRFGMFETESILGQIGFGEGSICPSYFNGPGGNRGLCPAVPVLPSRDHRLKKGELVFVDVGCGVEGYHSDKTMTYMFGGPLPEYAQEIHQRCVDIQNRIAGMLKPGAIPSKIYQTVMDGIDPGFLDNFMGFGKLRVKFLGHAIGLVIDELPVIAQGFDEPIEAGMVFALEPKKGIPGIGMVGIENTFIVTEQGAELVTGDNKGLIPVF